MMRLWIISILTLLLPIVGCTEKQTSPKQPSIEGLTLEQLRADTDNELIPAFLFVITTFLVDQSQADDISVCYEKLLQRSIRFLDQRAFQANGFNASLGTGIQAGPLFECLTRMGAIRLGQTTLVVEPGAEIPFTQAPINQEQIVKYSAAGGELTSVSLQNGDIGWMLTARPDPESPLHIHTRIQPVFTPRGLLNWPGAQRYIQKMSHRFEEGRLDVSLRDGDFIILAVKDAANRDLAPLEQFLFLQSGAKSKLRLYVIMCVKAEA